MTNFLRFIILEVSKKKKFKSLAFPITQQRKDKFIYLSNNQEPNQNTKNNKFKACNNPIQSLKSIKN